MYLQIAEKLKIRKVAHSVGTKLSQFQTIILILELNTFISIQIMH